MLIIKFLRLIFSSLIFLTKIFGIIISIYIAFSYPSIQLLTHLPALNLGVWLTVKLMVFLNDQLLEIQCSLSNLYKIRDEKLKLDSFAQTLKNKEKYLRDAEIFLAKQVEKHNQAKENLKKEVFEYHQELVNDFILKNSKNGTEH
tara:strand:- start:28 stop:462 length:435 start_codon:yes stop_codon:yes gene_type:complete